MAARKDCVSSCWMRSEFAIGVVRATNYMPMISVRRAALIQYSIPIISLIHAMPMADLFDSDCDECKRFDCTSNARRKWKTTRRTKKWYLSSGAKTILLFIVSIAILRAFRSCLGVFCRLSVLAGSVYFPLPFHFSIVCCYLHYLCRCHRRWPINSLKGPSVWRQKTRLIYQNLKTKSI